MLKFIGKNSSLFASIGVIVGFFVGIYSNFLNHFLVIFLGILFLIAVLKIDIVELVQNLKKPWRSVFLSVTKLIIIPFIIFLISKFIPSEYRVAFILLASTPAALATPGILHTLNGDVKVGFIVSVITNILAPFVMPFVLLFTIKTNIDFDVFSMFLNLLLIIFIPFFISIFLKKFTPGLVENFNKYSSAFLGIDLFLFNTAMICPYSIFIINNFEKSVVMAIFVIGFSLLLHLLGIIFSFSKKKEIVVTSIIIIAYFNAGLAVVLATKYFDEFTVLLTVLYEFIWAFGLIPLQWIFARNKR